MAVMLVYATNPLGIELCFISWKPFPLFWCKNKVTDVTENTL